MIVMDEDKLDNDGNIEAVDTDAPEAAMVQPPQKKKLFGFVTLLLGLPIALGAGGLGGFAAHEYFHTPPPDLSGVAQDIEALEKQLKAQTVRVSKIETQTQKEAARLTRDLSKLESEWQSGLAGLEAQITAVDNQQAAQPVVNKKPDNKGSNNVAPKADEAAYSNGPNPELLAMIDSLRGDVQKDFRAVKIRLKRLEERPAADITGGDSNIAASAGPVFPVDEILANIKASVPPDEAQNWWDKVLRKHVSLKRTDHDAAASVLKDIEAAILIEDWAQAISLAQQLPEPARTSVQEWIARARR